MQENSTSQFTQSQANEELSVHWFSSHCVRIGFKYRKQDLDNDIDGEIEIFKKSEDQKLFTTGSFVKVQLKAKNDKINVETGYLTFECTRKFMAFCDICVIPILLVVYDVDKEQGYYLYMQEYIINVLDRERESWRKNTSNVRVKIPESNLISRSNLNQAYLQSLAKDGTKWILSARNSKLFSDYLVLAKQVDDSDHFNKDFSNEYHICLDPSLLSSSVNVKYAIKLLKDKITKNRYTLGSLDITNDDSFNYSFFLYDSLLGFHNNDLKHLFGNTEELENYDWLSTYDSDIEMYKYNINSHEPTKIVGNFIDKSEYINELRGFLEFCEQLILEWTNLEENYFPKGSPKKSISELKRIMSLFKSNLELANIVVEKKIYCPYEFLPLQKIYLKLSRVISNAHNDFKVYGSKSHYDYMVEFEDFNMYYWELHQELEYLIYKEEESNETI